MSLGETRNGRHKSTRPHRPGDAIESLADFLRGDFDFIPSPELVIDDVRNTRPIAQQTALVSHSKWRVKARTSPA